MWNLSADAGAKTFQCNLGYTAWSAAGGFTGGVNVMSFGSSVASQTLLGTTTIRRVSATTGDFTTAGFFTTLGSTTGGVTNGAAVVWTAPVPILCHAKDASGVAAGVTMKNLRIFLEPAPS